jgi:hypothetical protein
VIEAQPEETQGEAERAAELNRLKATIGLGMDVRQFLEHGGGRALTARANAEIQAAQDAWVEHNPEDPDQAAAMRKKHFDARVAAAVLSWLGDIVTEGENAERNYIAQEEGS